MSQRMLIDGTHPEETRVVVLSGNRLDEFDFETSTKTQLKGNIYLAKVTRVEPSLQAAFVEYGGNRHGFLAFSEIHPDYYQIPVADREALLAEEARLQAKADAEADAEGETEDAAADHDDETGMSDLDADDDAPHAAEIIEDVHEAHEHQHEHDDDERPHDEALSELPPAATDAPAEAPDAVDTGDEDMGSDAAALDVSPYAEASTEPSEAPDSSSGIEDSGSAEPAAAERQPVETIGGDEAEEVVERRRVRPLRRYKIQEVIKRRQILLVQVVKEERGNKGAALTTYLSLAGRYCVLMPNTARGGGISRKIANPADRRKLRKVLSELEIPSEMGVIMRTAGVERSKPEIKRDLDFLLRAWDNVRELTLKSTAPCLVYEEGNLIKRAIRDLYTKDIDEVWVEGTQAYQTAKTFMRMLMPSHAKKVQHYNDPSMPLFYRYQVEGQLAQMHSPVVQLKSGGYIVINPTEALVAIDVNSGRATRERNIEETATKTNLEAADEVARQLRLRDLAGLIVIDFIDMEEGRNQRAVERRLKEAMKSDRARLQVGRISPFGLLELSRQRLRPSLLEASTEVCPLCRGAGHVRSTESTAVHVLRAIEEEGIRHRSEHITVSVPSEVALYILNQKRAVLTGIEARYGFAVDIAADESLIPPDFKLERVKARSEGHPSPAALVPPPMPFIEDDDEAIEEIVEEEDREEDERGDAASETDSEFASAPSRPHPDGERHEGGRRRRRRRRRGRGGEGRPQGEPAHQAPQSHAASPDEVQDLADAPQPDVGFDEQTGFADAPSQQPGNGHGQDGEARRRRRGRRGGRRRGGREGERRGPGGVRVFDETSGETVPSAAEIAWATGAPEELPEPEPRHEPPQTSPDEIAWSSGRPEAEVTPRPEAYRAEPASHREPPQPSPDEIAWSSGRPEAEPAATPEPQAEPTPPPAPEAPPSESKPKRGGWWQRITR
jgi:ribonuclease E